MTQTTLFPDTEAAAVATLPPPRQGAAPETPRAADTGGNAEPADGPTAVPAGPAAPPNPPLPAGTAISAGRILETPAVATEPPAIPDWTDTRRQALDRIGPVAGRIASQVFATIYAAGDEGRTDEEVATALGMRESTTRARRCELRDAGLVIDSGRRRRTTSGRAASVWVVASKDVIARGPAAAPAAAAPGTPNPDDDLPF